MKKMRNELLQANKKIAQLKRKQSEGADVPQAQPAGDGAAYEDDELPVESEDELEVTLTPVHSQFRSLGTITHPSKPNNPPRNLVRREDRPPARPPLHLPQAPPQPPTSTRPPGSPSPSVCPSRLPSPPVQLPSTTRSSSRHSTTATSPPQSRSVSLEPTPNCRSRSVSSSELFPNDRHGQRAHATRYRSRDSSSRTPWENESQVELELATPDRGRSSLHPQHTSRRDQGARSALNPARSTETLDNSSQSHEAPSHQRNHSHSHTELDEPSPHRSDARGRNSRQQPQAHDRRAQEHIPHAPPPAERPLDSILYQDGRMPAGRKARRLDYMQSTQRLIQQGCDLFNLNIVTIHAFPSAEQASKWAIDIELRPLWTAEIVATIGGLMRTTWIYEAPVGSVDTARD
ncbi:hypothetical protein PHLGIDRAFT_16852 [Phlebiopsis gigantea 11061_1 CR5-6]|uniref:Uncharacterized protein n=1 Tax=Phlebiopsis gigantea (strain 11061_1 CR5-6) TaxID=745531 RepID=A0A0C3S2S8_PHLG1|nr:hypothetical protein PHLGIDRAFT_16852 [Phlebiopsis gigantea 11061_1 CR5-6]